jgi:cytochrome c oxidase assembly protein subunit 15
MTSFLKDDRSTAVANWLFFTAFLVVVMVVVGGATRLTDSGLSITEWKPVAGALPPMSQAQWAEEFRLYQQIPQFSEMNPDMTLAAFKSIYWWEWWHRQLGRIVGLVYGAGFIFFLVRRMIPTRLIWLCAALLLLGGTQGFLGWWMVSSGLTERISVAPERLMIHLGLALLIFCGLVWAGLEAANGKGRVNVAGPYASGGLGLTLLIYIQSLLGGLVAANDAGRIYTDWPLMAGRVFPETYWTGGLWQTLAHNPASVQFHHRMIGYLIFILLFAFVAAAWNSRHMQPTVRAGATVLAGLGILQVALGIGTLMMVSPLYMSLIHQLVATLLLGTAVWFSWRARRE